MHDSMLLALLCKTGSHIARLLSRANADSAWIVETLLQTFEDNERFVLAKWAKTKETKPRKTKNRKPKNWNEIDKITWRNRSAHDGLNRRRWTIESMSVTYSLRSMEEVFDELMNCTKLRCTLVTPKIGADKSRTMLAVQIITNLRTPRGFCFAKRKPKNQKTKQTLQRTHVEDSEFDQCFKHVVAQEEFE
jgi:hypothetical protein